MTEFNAIELRKAARDAAYKLYGNEWKQYVIWGEFWNPDMDEREKKVCEDLINRANPQ